MPDNLCTAVVPTPSVPSTGHLSTGFIWENCIKISVLATSLRRWIHCPTDNPAHPLLHVVMEQRSSGSPHIMYTKFRALLNLVRHAYGCTQEACASPFALNVSISAHAAALFRIQILMYSLRARLAAAARAIFLLSAPRRFLFFCGRGAGFRGRFPARLVNCITKVNK